LNPIGKFVTYIEGGNLSRVFFRRGLVSNVH